VAQLRQHYGEIETLHARIVVVSFGGVWQARAWQEETGATFTLLLDPPRAAYRAYGLEHSRLRSWGPKVWWRYVQLLIGGRRWRGIQGDTAQLGGDLIVDRNGIVRLVYRSHDPTDRPSVSQLLETLKRINADR
jgi:peroxiredoxin